ncbi:MAG: GNAT family N-acetyltransferase [Bacteroidales bacterium]|nr:GNAT family N-acetyltransferase [Bacteroidales bacterium]
MNDLHDEVIISAIEKNLFEFYKLTGKSKFVKFIETNNYSYVKTNPNAWPNFIFDIKNITDDCSKLTDEIVTEIIENKAPPFLIYKYDNSINTFEHLLANGNIRPIIQWAGMACRYDKFNELKQNEELQIEIINNEQQLIDWINIINNEILQNKKINRKIFNELILNKKTNLFIGYYKNIPVCTSLAFEENNTGGLYLIATNSNYRNKGFGTQITYATIKYLLSKNNKLIVLQATKSGKKIYSNLGFKEYCKFNIAWMLGK